MRCVFVVEEERLFIWRGRKCDKGGETLTGQKSSFKVQSAQQKVFTVSLDTMAQYVRVSGSVGLITLQSPPVNALR